MHEVELVASCDNCCGDYLVSLHYIKALYFFARYEFQARSPSHAFMHIVAMRYPPLSICLTFCSVCA